MAMDEKPEASETETPTPGSVLMGVFGERIKKLCGSNRKVLRLVREACNERTCGLEKARDRLTYLCIQGPFEKNENLIDFCRRPGSTKFRTTKELADEIDACIEACQKRVSEEGRILTKEVAGASRRSKAILGLVKSYYEEGIANTRAVATASPHKMRKMKLFLRRLIALGFVGEELFKRYHGHRADDGFEGVTFEFVNYVETRFREPRWRLASSALTTGKTKIPVLPEDASIDVLYAKIFAEASDDLEKADAKEAVMSILRECYAHQVAVRDEARTYVNFLKECKMSGICGDKLAERYDGATKKDLGALCESVHACYARCSVYGRIDNFAHRRTVERATHKKSDFVGEAFLSLKERVIHELRDDVYQRMELMPGYLQNVHRCVIDVLYGDEDSLFYTVHQCHDALRFFFDPTSEAHVQIKKYHGDTLEALGKLIDGLQDDGLKEFVSKAVGEDGEIVEKSFKNPYDEKQGWDDAAATPASFRLLRKALSECVKRGLEDPNEPLSEQNLCKLAIFYVAVATPEEHCAILYNQRMLGALKEHYAEAQDRAVKYQESETSPVDAKVSEKKDAHDITARTSSRAK